MPIFSAHFEPDDETRRRIVEAAVLAAKRVAPRQAPATIERRRAGAALEPGS